MVVFVGNVVARGLGFLFPVVVANVLDRPDFAVTMFLINTGFFAGELILTGFPTAMTRALAAERAPTAHAGWIVAALIGGLPLLVTSAALGAVLAIGGDAPVGLLILVIVGLTIDAYYFALLRGLRRFGWLAVYRVAANLAQLAVVLIVALSGVRLSVELVVAVYSLIYLAPIALIELVDGPARRALRGSAATQSAGRQRGPTRLAALTRFAVPALLSGTAYGAILGFDVFFVRVFAPNGLADYAAARSLALPLMLVPFALSVVLLPQVAGAPDGDIGRLLRRALTIAVAAAVAGWLAYGLGGATVIEWLFPASYAAAAEPLSVLVPAIAVLGVYSILSGWMMGIGRPWVSALCLSAGALVTLVAHLAFTARLGAVGAGIAIGLGSATALALIAVAAWRILRTGPRLAVSRRMGGGGAGPRRRVFLIGFYGVHNLGDEAIRSAIMAAAPTHGAEVIAVASRDPRDPDPRAVPMAGLGLVRYLGAIVRSDRVVLGGGGILKDEGLRIPLELFSTAFVARLLGKQVALLAVGVGPFYSRAGRWLARATARLAAVRTVRDAASRDALARLGVGGVALGADPTFSFVSAGPAVPSGASTPAAPARRLVLSLRPWFLRAPDGDARQAGLRAAVAAALQPLVAAGWSIRLVSLYWPRDQVESTAMAADPRLAGAAVADAELDWDGLTAEVRMADLVVAMRYHAVAAAAQAQRPTIALAYEPKVRALAMELGLPCLDVDDPHLAAGLADAIAAATAGPGSSRPDPAALASLRDRSAESLAMALGDWDPPSRARPADDAVPADAAPAIPG